MPYQRYHSLVLTIAAVAIFVIVGGCGDGSNGSSTEECPLTCEQGASRCSADGEVEICELDASGCTTWQKDSPCLESERCDEGQCVPDGAVPGAPTGVEGWSRDEGAFVQWQEPADTGDAPITDYHVVILDEDGEISTDIEDETHQVGEASDSSRIEGLTNDVAYRFGVQAENEFGLGERSELSEPIVPRAAFISEWTTDNDWDYLSGEDLPSWISDENQIELPLESAGSYHFDVYWGDGNADTITDGEQSEIRHTYDSHGTYTVVVDGEVEGWRFDTDGDAPKLEEIEQWGGLRLGNGGGYFSGATNLDVTAEDLPDLDGTTDLSRMFEYCRNLEGNPSFRQWDIGEVEDTSWMFYHAELFNQDIGDWDVSNVVSMVEMFGGAAAFDQDIGDWDVGNVEDTSGMFRFALVFDQDLDNWDVSNVVSMPWMFAKTEQFNGNIGNWDVGNVEDMTLMFASADSFGQDLDGWDVSNLESADRMFAYASSFNHDLGDWDVGNVTDMTGMFTETRFNQDIGTWDVSNVTTMSGMFRDASNFDQDIGNWNVSNVGSMWEMFGGALAFDQDLGDWDVGNVSTMSSMFEDVEMSPDNYDSLLTGWSDLSPDLQDGVEFSAGNSRYTATVARNVLIDDHSWEIEDDGLID